MESDKLKTGDLVLRNRWEGKDWGTPELTVILWANNYIFIGYNRYGQTLSQPQDLAKDYKILQRIDMYGGRDEV